MVLGGAALATAAGFFLGASLGASEASCTTVSSMRCMVVTRASRHTLQPS